MPTIAAKGSNRKSHCAVVSAVTVLLAAWSAPGLAASPSVADAAQDLASLESLRTEFVDLSDMSASPEDSDDLNDAVAPLLFLTPRVASILEDVFGDSEDPASPPADEPREPAASPVVDHDSAREMVDTASPMYEHAAILPRFQRQMYRTDI